MSYPAFFEELTGFAPYPYQERLGSGAWPDLLDIPTGLGKTASVVVAWLWRVLQQDAASGRRLVYCLPMRTLVEQTERAAEKWCKKAAPHFTARQLKLPTVHALLGGSVDEAWELLPQHPALLIGTQDMLLSRALNRGYGMSRFKWPVHFGLLNNDATWVFDETQLMGVGVETSAQLAALREKLGSSGGRTSVWMSATLGREQLATVDHPEPNGGWTVAQLDSEDAAFKDVAQRVSAAKPIAQLAELTINKDSRDRAPALLAAAVLELHQARGGLTLVIVNRVDRAQAVFKALNKSAPELQAHLVHSRFRAAERQALMTSILATGDRVVVATQALEAGVDISAKTLVTELAPWPSLVQRFGRCNRHGEQPDARVLWVDVAPADAKDDARLPYELDDLTQARELLGQLAAAGGAGPQALRQVAYTPPRVIRPVLRRKDLVDLFDTTPDLLGNDLDVSRYVRDGDDLDVLVYWRAFEGKPGEAQARPGRDELCRVSIGQAKRFLEALKKKRASSPQPAGSKAKQQAAPRATKGGAKAKKPAASAAPPEVLTPWLWDAKDGAWQRCTAVRPGQTLLLHVGAGGYDPALGWTGEIGGLVPEALTDAAPGNEALTLEGDSRTLSGVWVTLRDHLEHVRGEANGLAEALPLSAEQRLAVVTAAEWHDLGKAHAAFQHMLGVAALADPVDEPYAKSDGSTRARSPRRYFRHELASALAWLQSTPVEDPQRDLIAFLIAAHHGKVRLSIRSIPGETEPSDPAQLFARGVWQGDSLPAFTLPVSGGVAELSLDLSPMRLGAGSWLERMAQLRDQPELGPFRLAFLEALVRVADWTASAKEVEGQYDA